jgi:GNAT superfamily N-acetyltransferase
MSLSDRIVVRPATQADKAFALGLVPKLRAFGPSALRPLEALDAGETRVLGRAFDALPAGAVLLIAEDPGGSALGLAYAETAVDYFTQEEHGHLGILAVAEEAEGRGVGRALLAAVEGWSADQGHRFLTLNVFQGNTRARAVYERNGYEPDFIRYVKTRTT